MTASEKRTIESLRDLMRSRSRLSSGAAPTTVVGRIDVGSSPPSQSERFWRFQVVRAEGPEEEGGAAAFYVVTGSVFHYAVNLGSKNPVHGQRMLFHNCDGYWFFECHGSPELEDSP